VDNREGYRRHGGGFRGDSAKDRGSNRQRDKERDKWDREREGQTEKERQIWTQRAIEKEGDRDRKSKKEREKDRKRLRDCERCLMKRKSYKFRETVPLRALVCYDDKTCMLLQQYRWLIVS
jgi:hypothetical protein